MNETELIREDREEELETLRRTCRELEETVQALRESNVLWGKKYFAAGDSFTHGDFKYGKQEERGVAVYDEEWGMFKTYPWWIARRNHMTLVCDGINGSIMPLAREYVRGDKDVGADYRCPFSFERYKKIPSDTDYITLWFGCNDCWHTILGSPDDTTNTTFCGAWNVVLEYLLIHYPFAKIGIIVTNCCTAAYQEATRVAARRWGIPYLDMSWSDQTPVILDRDPSLGVCERALELRRDAFYVSKQNSHPNLEAHRYESTFIEDFLRRL